MQFGAPHTCGGQLRNLSAGRFQNRTSFLIGIGVCMAGKSRRQVEAARENVLVDLALQGGGSHGAFTWGVLDRLLEEPWVKIEAISGTSAGAMNAAVLVSGFMHDGAAGARKALDAYWGRVADAARYSPIQRSPLDRLLNRWSLDTSPGYIMLDLMSRLVSPYNLNPMGHNPIRGLLEESIDFAHLNEAPIKLFITATNVHTGRGRIFRNKEITPEVLLASACLPTMFQAIEIDGEPYWDGGYAGNPTISPLVRESEAHDVILVQINPRERRQTPRTASEILDRLNEISFNAPLLKELRMIALLRQAADPGTGEGRRWAEMRTHRIVTDKLQEFGATSKLNAEGAFLQLLKEEGRKTAEGFLAEHGDDLGKRSTADLDVLLAEC
jgi:NTE family protein